MGKMKRVNRPVIHSVITPPPAYSPEANAYARLYEPNTGGGVMGRAPWRKGEVSCLLRHKAGGKFTLATAGRSRVFEEGS